MSVSKPLLVALGGRPVWPPPIWLMRQAGRYLPEYRAVRAHARDFLELCYTPALAAEVSLQPIRRFGFDAAILFSDILVIPHALGQTVRYIDGEGPVLEPWQLVHSRLDSSKCAAQLAPIYETVRRVRAELPENVALIGFAGAPWTVAAYMIEGHGSRDFAAARAWLYRAPEQCAKLLAVLVEVTAEYLVAQVSAGADVIQIFDTWAGLLPEPVMRRWSVEPIKAIIRKVRKAHPGVAIIIFPRGVGIGYETFAAECGADAVSIDPSVPLAWASEKLQSRCVVQGNLDPVALLAGGDVLENETRRIMRAMRGGPFVFNLGHGILPQTAVENVGRLVELVRGGV